MNPTWSYDAEDTKEESLDEDNTRKEYLDIIRWEYNRMLKHNGELPYVSKKTLEQLAICIAWLNEVLWMDPYCPAWIGLYWIWRRKMSKNVTF